MSSFPLSSLRSHGYVQSIANRGPVFADAAWSESLSAQRNE